MVGMQTFTPFPPSRRILVFSVFILAGVFAVLKIDAQDNNSKLKKQIFELAEVIESEQASNPSARLVLKFLNELKVAANFDRPDIIKSLNNSANLLILGKHYDSIFALLDQITKETAIKSEQERKDWVKDVDALVRKTEKACVEDAPSSELEKLVVEVVGVKLRQPETNISNSMWLKITSSKLDSASKLLGNWIEYKRFSEKKYHIQAAEKFNSIVRLKLSFPILEKDFLVAKVAQIDKLAESTEDLSRSRDSEYPKRLTKPQQDILDTLDARNLEADTLVKAFTDLESQRTSKENLKLERVINSLQALAECLSQLESRNYAIARERLSYFSALSAPSSELENYRTRVVSDLTPLLYSEIKALPRKPNQHIKIYLFNLISEPRSLSEIAVREDFINFYWDFIGNRSGSDWFDASERQYRYLLSASSAMETADYVKALEGFRYALDHSGRAGPAEATEFIKGQIKKIRSISPTLFDLETSPYFKEIRYLKSRVSKLEKKLAGKTK